MTNFATQATVNKSMFTDVFKSVIDGELLDEEKQSGIAKGELHYDSLVTNATDKNTLHEDNRLVNILLGEIITGVRARNPLLFQSILVNQAELIERLSSMYLNLSNLPLHYPSNAFMSDIKSQFIYKLDFDCFFKRYISQTDVGCTCIIKLSVKVKDEIITREFITLKEFSIDLTPEWTLKYL